MTLLTNRSQVVTDPAVSGRRPATDYSGGVRAARIQGGWRGAFAIARVQLSFASIIATPTGAERFATAFYNAMWSESTGIRSLFPAGMESMRQRFATAVGWVVARLHEPGTVDRFLAQLARDHRK
ncbi:hypothetical protein NJ76_10265, partial [Rhodococcus sp. IITR03]